MVVEDDCQKQEATAALFGRVLRMQATADQRKQAPGPYYLWDNLQQSIAIS